MFFFCNWKVPAQWIGLAGETEEGREGAQRFHHVKSCQTCWVPPSVHLKLHLQNKFECWLGCISEVKKALTNCKTYHSFIRLWQTDLQTANVLLVQMFYSWCHLLRIADRIQSQKINTNNKATSSKKTKNLNPPLYQIGAYVCLSTCCIVILLVILAAIGGTCSMEQVTTGMKNPVEFRCLPVYYKLCLKKKKKLQKT